MTLVSVTQVHILTLPGQLAQQYIYTCTACISKAQSLMGLLGPKTDSKEWNEWIWCSKCDTACSSSWQARY